MSQQIFLRPLHIIHIDDSAVGREAVKAVLEVTTYPQFVVHSFASITEAQALARASVGQLDCAVLDLGLAESSGIATFMRAMTTFTALPLIVLTGVDNINLACQLVYHGADNYLNKGALVYYLPVFIATAVARRQRPIVPMGSSLQTAIKEMADESLVARLKQHE